MGILERPCNRGKGSDRGPIGVHYRQGPSFQESPFLGRIQGVEAVEVGGAAGWPPANGVGWLRLDPIRLALSDTITARPAPGGLRVGLAATSPAGERLAVQGLSWRRWRCWPSALESSFLG